MRMIWIPRTTINVCPAAACLTPETDTHLEIMRRATRIL